MNFNEFSTGDNSVIIIENTGMGIPLIQDFQGNFSITVSTPQGSDTLYLSEIGGDPSIPSIVAMHTTVIKMTVMEGA